MNSGKVRIYELSRELDLDNKDVLAICDRLNIVTNSHSSVITEQEAAQVRSAAEHYDPNLTEDTRGRGLKTQRKGASKSSVRKQQILGVRRTRPTSAPKPPKPADIQSLTVRRTLRTGQGYTESLLEVEDAIPLHMVLIPGGKFTMGSPDNELGRSDWEGPQHEVTVPQFFMGRYPVTQAQYEAVMDTNPATKYDNDRFVASNKPVVGVTWHDAVEFCDRLSELTKRPYRLPTEAEWEYACRAGATTPFHFGETITSELANYRGTEAYGNGSEGEYLQETTPINQFDAANAFGLVDMHGNVLEWCQDHWHENYKGAPTDGSAWVEGGDSDRRVVRGGSWIAYPGYCRSACRGRFDADDHVSRIGFRVVCSAPRILL